MSNELEEINTDHLMIKLERKPNCIIHLEIRVNSAGVKAAHAKAIKTVNKEVSLPGFRKGKAPDALILQQYNKYVNQEWHDILVNVAFHEYLEKTHLYPFSTGTTSIKRAEVKNANLENGADLIIQYEAKPTVPTIDISQVKLAVVKKDPITPEEVDDVIEQIRLYHAQWTEVTDRPIQEGDYVNLTINSTEDPPRKICTDMRFHVAEGKMGGWMYKLLIGHHKNDTVNGTSEWDQPSMPPPPDFQATPCKIEILSVWHAELPSLDNELAKKVGLQAIDDLRPRVEADLNRKAQDETLAEKRVQIENQLIEQYPFEIPVSLFENQRKEMLNKSLQQLNAKEISNEDKSKRKNEIEHAINQNLQNAYRLFFLTRDFAENNNIDVYENEITQEIIRQISLPEDERVIDFSLSEAEVRSKLYVNILSRKVLDFLASKVSVDPDAQ